MGEENRYKSIYTIIRFHLIYHFELARFKYNVQ